MNRNIRLDLTLFFHEEHIDAFAIVSVDDLIEPDRADVLQFFSAAQSVIVFGKEVPAEAYLKPAKEKSREMIRIAEALDDSAIKLAKLLNDENIPTVPIPLYLPIKMKEGRVQGVVRLKHIAAAGRLGLLGQSSVLLTSRFGPRLMLSGVVTARPVQEFSPGDRAGKGVDPLESKLCTGCERCIRVCPGGAFGPDGVDAFRCSSVREWVPPLLVPAAKWLLRRQLLLKCMAPFAYWAAGFMTIPCSRCVTKCPNFGKSEEQPK